MSAEIGTLVDYGKKYVVSYRKPFQSAVDSLTQWNKKKPKYNECSEKDEGKPIEISKNTSHLTDGRVVHYVIIFMAISLKFDFP